MTGGLRVKARCVITVTYIRVTGNSIFQPDRYVGACVT